MFRRSKTETADTAKPTVVKEGGKGRPTPTRREAQAAARARASAGKDKRSGGKAQRQRRAQQNARAREGMRNGDERFLPARDQGKVRRFVRDRVDSRINMAELLLPLLLVIMVLQYTGNPRLVGLSNGLWVATLLVVIGDTVILAWRIRRELGRRFPDESHRGAVFYGLVRALQLRFMRIPKPKVKLGQRLPDRY